MIAVYLEAVDWSHTNDPAQTLPERNLAHERKLFQGSSLWGLVHSS